MKLETRLKILITLLNLGGVMGVYEVNRFITGEYPPPYIFFMFIFILNGNYTINLNRLKQKDERE